MATSAYVYRTTTTNSMVDANFQFSINPEDRYKGPEYPDWINSCKLRTYTISSQTEKHCLNILNPIYQVHFGNINYHTLTMPQSSGLSRYDHLKAIFSRQSSQQPEAKEDTTSETTLVPRYVTQLWMEWWNIIMLTHSRQTQAKSYKKRHIPQNYNGEHPNPNVMAWNIS